MEQAKKPRPLGEFPVLRMNNITATGEMDLSDLKYMNLEPKLHDRYLVRQGDVLFNRTNSVLIWLAKRPFSAIRRGWRMPAT